MGKGAPKRGKKKTAKLVKKAAEQRIAAGDGEVLEDGNIQLVLRRADREDVKE